jgi:hypothetical protein
VAERDINEYKDFDLEQSLSRLLETLNATAEKAYTHAEYISYLKQL